MGVVKRTISVDPDVWASVEALARAEHVGASTVINRLLRHELLIQRGLASVQEWENQHGAFTQEELAEADRILDQLGVAATPRRAARRTARNTAGPAAASRRAR